MTLLVFFLFFFCCFFSSVRVRMSVRMSVCMCVSFLFCFFKWQHDDSRPPRDNGLKCVRGVSLKSALLESDHVSSSSGSRRRRRRREKPLRAATRASARCHVTGRRNTGAVVWCQCKLSPASLCTNSLFRKWEEEGKLLIKDVPTL